MIDHIMERKNKYLVVVILYHRRSQGGGTSPLLRDCHG